MKKRGFTLIELLAVIVILAIIALITTPIVINVIKDIKIRIAERNAENVGKAAEIYFYSKKINSGFNGITFTCKSNKCASGEEVLNIKGKVPENGLVTIKKDGTIAFDLIVIDGYNCFKENNSYKCDKTTKINEETTTGTLILDSKISKLSNYKIYGNSYQNIIGSKNLFLLDDLLKAPKGELTSSAGNTYEVTNLLELKLKGNTNYTISSLGLTGSLDGAGDANRSLYINDADSTSCVFDGHPVVIKTNQTGIVKIGLFGTRTNAQTIINKTAKIQIEEGTTATTYEEYMGGVVSPNPKYPQEIESVGDYDEATGKYKISIMTSGNIFNYHGVKIMSVGNGGTFKQENNSLIFNNPKSYSNYLTVGVGCIKLKPNTKYISKAIVTEINNGSQNPSSAGSMQRSLRLQTLFNTYDSKAIYIVNGYSGYKGANSEIITRFKTPANLSDYKYVVTRMADNTEVVFKDIIIMEDVGQTIEEFESYVEPITTDIYLDEPLRKVGDYIDYIDFKNEIVVRNVKKIELTSASNMNIYTWGNKNNSKGVYFSGLLDNSYNRNSNALSNRNYNSWAEQETYDNPTGMWLGVGNDFFYWLGILDTLKLTTLKEFKQWLADNPTYVLYGSKNPTTTKIELPNIQLLEGTTILSVETNITPSKFEVEYYE